MPGLLDWLGLGGAPAFAPNEMAYLQSQGALPAGGMLDPRAIRQQAAWGALTELGGRLAEAGARRPAAQPGPGVGSALAGAGQAYQRGLQGATMNAMLDQQARQNQAYQSLVAGLPEQQRGIFAAIPAEQGAAMLAQSAVRPRARIITDDAEGRSVFGENWVPGGTGYIDQNGIPHLTTGPALTGANTRAEVSIRGLEVPGQGGSRIFPYGAPGGPGPRVGGGMAGPTPAPAGGPPQEASGDVPGVSRPWRADDFDPPDPAYAASANEQMRARQGDRNAALPPRTAQAMPTPTVTQAPGVGRVIQSPYPPASSPEGAQDRLVGETLGQQFRDIEAANTTARTTLGQLDRLQAVFNGIQRGGPVAPALLRIRAIAQQFGINLGDVDQEQAAQALSNEFALQLRNPAGGAGMPGAMSDADREFLVGMALGLSQTPQGRDLIIEARRRMAIRDQEVASFTRRYMRENNNRLDLGFGDALASHFASRPMFGEDFQRRMQQIVGGAPAPTGGQQGALPPGPQVQPGSAQTAPAPQPTPTPQTAPTQQPAARNSNQRQPTRAEPLPMRVDRRTMRNVPNESDLVDGRVYTGGQLGPGQYRWNQRTREFVRVD